MQQMTTAFEEKSKDPEDESFAKLKEIKVTTVDSFQVIFSFNIYIL